MKKKLCELLTEQKLPEDYYAVYKNITKFAFWEWEDIIKCSYEDEFNTTSKNKIKSIVNKRDKILTNLQFKSNTKYIKKKPHQYWNSSRLTYQCSAFKYLYD